MKKFPKVVTDKYEIKGLQPRRTKLPGGGPEVDLTSITLKQAKQLAKRYPQYFEKKKAKKSSSGGSGKKEKDSKK